MCSVLSVFQKMLLQPKSGYNQLLGSKSTELRKKKIKAFLTDVEENMVHIL